MKKICYLVISSIFIIFCVYGFAYIIDAPSIGLDHSLEMYDKDGDLFYASSNDHYGSYVNLENVSPHFLNAIIAIEDKNFYIHPGFDVIGIMRAIYSNFTTQSLSQGASTISQQYIKNLFLSNERTWERKLKEAWLTIRVEVHYDKDEILEGYVNTIYFGAGIYGIENAAKYYFNKSAKDLTLLEGSMLAGMINGPELYAPYSNYDLTKERQQLVLKAMKKNGYIDEKTYQDTINQDTLLYEHTKENTLSTLGYFRQYVYATLEALGYDHFDGTLKVYTTLDTDLQNTITSQISKTVTDDLQQTCVIMEPNSGALRVLIGGKNYYDSQFNRATDAYRQMASTIKPLLYYEALINGFHPLSKFISEKTTFYLDANESYSPSNYNDEYPNKEISMIEAIAKSDNIYAVKMHLFLGTDCLSNRLEKLGYKNVSPNASLALGTKETSPIQLCTLYNCIASKGMYYEPYCIDQITDVNGNVLYNHQIKGQRKLEESYCLILSQMLTATFCNELEGTMRYYPTSSTFAAKTGTSDWDSWLVTYNPEMTIAMWAGFDDNKYLNNLHLTKNREVFYQVFKDYQNMEWYHPNSDLIIVPIDLESGTIKENGSPFWFYHSSKKIRI